MVFYFPFKVTQTSGLLVVGRTIYEPSIGMLELGSFKLLKLELDLVNIR